MAVGASQKLTFELVRKLSSRPRRNLSLALGPKRAHLKIALKSSISILSRRRLLLHLLLRLKTRTYIEE